MATANLNRFEKSIDGFDSIIITKDVADVPCGVTLDVSEYAEDTIKSGHLLIQNNTTFVVKPLGITSGGNYSALPSGHSYFGINKTTILKAMPMAAVLRIGQVNAAAAKEFVGAEYPAAAKTALNKIDFIY